MSHNCFTATPTLRGKHVFAFISPQGAGPMSCPLLDGCILTGGVDVKTDTQVVKMKCPSNVNRNSFDVVSQFTVQKEVDTQTSLSARLPADMRSLFLKLTQAGCSFDMVWASGVCSDPNDLNQFDRLEVFEGVFVGFYGHDAVGTFDQSEIGEDVLETVELTVMKYFDFAKPDIVNTITLSGGSFTDVVYCPAGCAILPDCTINNADGCAFPLATAIFTGSTNLLTLYYSTDGGGDMDSMPVGADDFTDASVTCYAGQVIVGHNGTGSLYYYASQSDVINGTATFYPVGTGPGLKVGATDGVSLYMLGNGVYKLTRGAITTGPTLVAGTAGTAMNAMDQMFGKFVAVGDGGNIELVKSSISTQLNSPTASDLVTISMATSKQWWIGTVDGDIYWTDTGGDTWAYVDNLGSNPGIMFASKYIGYASTDDGLYMTVDGGCSWLPQYYGGSYCGMDICDNGNRFVACRGGSLVVGMDKLSQCLFEPINIDDCLATGLSPSFTLTFVCGDNPDEITLELRNTTFAGSATITDYSYSFLSGPVIGNFPAPLGDLDVTVPVPGASDDVYNIILNVDTLECGMTSTSVQTITVPCNIIACAGECIVCGGEMLIFEGCACA